MPQTRTILFIEDESQQREVLTMLFETEGYAVISVETAEAALQTLASQKPDLFVTDVKLPGIDGFTFFEQVREQPAMQQVPFIFVTGYNDPKAIQRIQELTSVGYVTKPYDLEALVNLVKKYLPLNS